MASETVQSSAEVPRVRVSLSILGNWGEGRTQKAEIQSFSSSWLGSEIAKGWERRYPSKQEQRVRKRPGREAY